MKMPPPTDEQQEMQQKMMKFMMIFFGLMFYKVAAGLCLYFIASSVWGFAERKLLPKSKGLQPGVAGGPTASTGTTSSSDQITTTPRMASSTAITAPSGVATSKKPGRNKRKGSKGAPQARQEEASSQLARLGQRLSNWWNEVLEQAKKK
jgi:YidC/Oxa1 family membrane protein insertase